MIVLSHPTGNNFVRALLKALAQSDYLYSFHTTLAFNDNDWLMRLSSYLQGFKRQLARRNYNLPASKVYTYPGRELLRLSASHFNISWLTQHESGLASVDAVYRHLDQKVASFLRQEATASGKDNLMPIAAVYCYEDGALQSFRQARELGIKCIYDLPIAYWQTSQQLLKEEAERLPAWEPTLVGTKDSAQKLERKAAELQLADLVVCPSKFVLDTLPNHTRTQIPCLVSEFGSPEIHNTQRPPKQRGPLRLLFAGSMTQRKGLADVFAAVKLLNTPLLELVVMGKPVVSMEFYRKQLSSFTWEAPRPHQEVLRLMQSCDVFVLPSIVEGRALVQQEAMISELPLIVTRNAGGEDLIEEGKTGFLVPARSPEKIAEKIAWFLEHHNDIREMGYLARQKAATLTWASYQQKILDAIISLVASK